MDLDNDGYQDIVSGQYHPGQITWFRGTQRGFSAGIALDQWGYESSQRYDISGTDERSFSYWNYTSPTFGDLDGDGDLDLVVGGGHGLRVSMNEGTREIPFFGRRELLLTPNSKPLQVRAHTQEEIDTVKNNDPSGGHYLELNPAGDFKTAPLLVDWDRDGVLDLIVGDSNAKPGCHGISFFRGVGDGTYLPAVQLMTLMSGAGKWLPGDGPRVSVTDWNEDGTPDLLVGIGVPYLDGKFSEELAWAYSSVKGVESPGKAPGRWSDEERARVLEMVNDQPELAKHLGDPRLWTLNYRGHVYVLLGEETGSKATPIAAASNGETRGEANGETHDETPDGQGGIEWKQSLEGVTFAEVKAQAKEEGKAVFLYFKTKW